MRLLEGSTVREGFLTVIQDRLRIGSADSARLNEAVEAALRGGRGKLLVHALDEAGEVASTWRYSSALHCAECDISYQDPLPSHFSFNSALGACETCKGFGRVIGVDYDLVIPDHAKDAGRWRDQALANGHRQAMPGRHDARGPLRGHSDGCAVG